MYVGPYFEDAIAMTPSDTTDDPAIPQLSYFAGFVPGVTGNFKFKTPTGQTPTMQVVAGTVYYVPIKRLFITGSATSQSAVGLVKFVVA